jgi:hypothetical protein
MFIYTSIGFYFFPDMYYNNGELTCSTMWLCYLTSVKLGLTLGGGISEFLGGVVSFQPANRTRYYIRWIFDLFWFATINIMFMNIIFGIIVDTFGGIV